MIGDTERRALLDLARAAVNAAVRQTTLPEALDDIGIEASGAFVTLKREGMLRGCIGTLQCRATLTEEIARAAVSAALEDPRFEPVGPGELAELEFEISVLGPLEPIDPHAPDAFEIGRHGLVVEHGLRRGLLLPQVATEQGWGREEFLAYTSRKAGLPADAWRRAVVYRFTAEVFGE